MLGRFVLVVVASLLLSACGPIFGQVMRVNEGVKEFRVVSGSLSTLRPGSRIVVVGPFAKTGAAYEICRGDDAANFAEKLRGIGFTTELYLDRGEIEPQKLSQELRGLTAAELAQRLELATPPDLILLGVLTQREATVAPARGIVVSEAFRLEFVDPVSRQSVVIDLAVRSIAQEALPRLVEELRKRLVD